MPPSSSNNSRDSQFSTLKDFADYVKTFNKNQKKNRKRKLNSTPIKQSTSASIHNSEFIDIFTRCQEDATFWCPKAIPILLKYIPYGALPHLFACVIQYQSFSLLDVLLQMQIPIPEKCAVDTIKALLKKEAHVTDESKPFSGDGLQGFLRSALLFSFNKWSMQGEVRHLNHAEAGLLLEFIYNMLNNNRHSEIIAKEIDNAEIQANETSSEHLDEALESREKLVCGTTVESDIINFDMKKQLYNWIDVIINGHATSLALTRQQLLQEIHFFLKGQRWFLQATTRIAPWLMHLKTPLIQLRKHPAVGLYLYEELCL